MLSGEPTQENLWARARGIVMPLTGVFLLLGVTTAGVQINAGAQSLYRSEQNIVTSKAVSPPRGLFYDRHGQKLNVNVNSYTLSLRQSDLSAEELSTVLGIISTHTGVSVEDLQAKLPSKTTDRAVLASGLTSEMSVILATALRDYQVDIVTDTHRHYLFPEQYSQIIGYTGLAALEDLEAGFTATDDVGKYRLEKILDTELRGIKGQEITSSTGESSLAGVPGNNVFLTIDNQWQQALYRILGNQVDQLGGRSGAAVIVDTSNGEVWAYASYPGFDTNKFETGISNSDYQQLLADNRKPLIDKVIGTQSSPGSTYKLIAAYAAIENGIVDANYNIFSNRCMYLGDYPFCEYGRFFIGDMDVVRALARSSNIFFCQSILELSSQQSFDKYLDAARVLGMGAPTGIMLEGEVAGILATPELKQKQTGQGWFAGDTCNSIIGQGMTAVTPIQMVMMVSTFFNGGKLYQPTIVARIEDQEGNVVQDDFHKLVREVPISETSRSLIQSGMYNVVNTSEGTDYWYLSHIPLNFYAKTGSAETYDVVNGEIIPQVDGWIEGTFDHDGRKFAFAANIKFAGGSWNVSQVIMRFGNCLINNFADGCDQI